MVKLEKLIQNHAIKIIVDDKDYTNFLIWAKENDCLWYDGRIIQPIRDKPNEKTDIVIITKDKLILHPSGYQDYYQVQKAPVYYFNDGPKDMIPNEDAKLRQSIKDKQKALQLEEAVFEEHIKHQREINRRQLKYQKYTHNLPKQFFVKYKDTNELIELFHLLNSYGYENYYNINPMYLNEKPCVLLIDNKEMNFSLASIKIYAYAVKVGIKFYMYEEFISMLKNIFKENKEERNKEKIC